MKLLRSLELTAWSQICGLTDRVSSDKPSALRQAQAIRERYVALMNAILRYASSPTSPLAISVAD